MEQGTAVFGSLAATAFDWPFLASLAGIVLIDLILAGDNAVAIAMAVRSLPRHQRRRGVLLGAGAAVLLRVAATFFVARLLLVPWLKLAGGVAVAWIAVRLFAEEPAAEGAEASSAGLWRAVRTIVVADVTMSLDNMLAVGGASHGSLALLLFGLALSIPLVVVASSLLSTLMDRYPVIVYAGAAMLGKVAAEMALTDPFTAGLLHPSRATLWAAEVCAAAGVVAAGVTMQRAQATRVAPAATVPEPVACPVEDDRP
jgi:YjbE family integral membrane protein